MSRAVAVVACMPVFVAGHAFIYYPPLRGGAENTIDNEYCPQCLGSTDLPMPTCGKGKWLSWSAGPVTALSAGSQVEMEIRVTAHHMGHFMFRLCDQVLNDGFGGLANEDNCLNQHILERVRPEELHSDCQPNDLRPDCQPYDDANPGYWYLPPSGGHNGNYAANANYKIHYRVPSDVACEKCTLQFWWMSSNSGSPHVDAYNCYFQRIAQLGWNADAWCYGACTYNGACPAVQGSYRNVGEQFKNCADVRIINSGNAAPNPTPQVSVPRRRRASPTSAPQVSVPRRRRASVATPRRRRAITSSDCSGVRCETVGYCRSQWGYCGSGSNYCNEQSKWTSACDSSAVPEPEPEPESETATEAAPESESEAEAEAEPASESEAENEGGSAQCVAVTGLNNGVTNSHCSNCESGYKFWPCNFEGYCSCSAPCMWDGYWKCGGELSQVGSTRHLRAAKPHGALSKGSMFIQSVVNEDVTPNIVSSNDDISDEL